MHIVRYAEWSLQWCSNGIELQISASIDKAGMDMVFSLDQSCSSYLSLFLKHPYVSDLTSTVLSLVTLC